MKKISAFCKRTLTAVGNWFKSLTFKKIGNGLLKAFKYVGRKILKILNQPVILNSFMAILAGLLVGFIVMLAVSKDTMTGQWDPANAWAGLMKVITGGAQTLQSLGNVFFKAAPLILVGLSVGFAFKTGLFNIGGSGQFMVGGIASLYVANLVVMPAPWHFILAVLAGIVAGAIWGFIPGLLKAFFNVNEVITTIMMNYIAMYLTYMLAYSPLVYDNLLTSVNVVFPTAHIPKWGLDTLFPRSNIDISILIAIFTAVVIWFILRKTTLGYELKAVGHSTEGSRYAGINYRKSVILSMMIAGALAGLAAAMNYLPLRPDYFRPITKINAIGFDGISIALIAQSNPLGIIFSGILISYIKQGALTMQILGFDKQITNIVISVIIYMIAISSFIGTMFKRRREKAKLKKLLMEKEATSDVL